MHLNYNGSWGIIDTMNLRCPNRYSLMKTIFDLKDIGLKVLSHFKAKENPNFGVAIYLDPFTPITNLISIST